MEKNNLENKKRKIIFQAEVKNFVLIPWTAMTRRGQWRSKRAQNYLACKKALAWELKKQWQGKEPITQVYKLSFFVYLPVKKGRHADITNCQKALEDSLKYAGIIKDDNQTVEIERAKIVRRAKEGRIGIVLKQL